jgi:hypothetical protein
MKQGSTFVLVVKLGVDMKFVNSVIFTIENKGQKLTKEDWLYENDKFKIPFTQEETVLLEGRTLIEAQINFDNGSVTKTDIQTIYIDKTLATRIMDGNKAVDEYADVELTVEDSVVFGPSDYEKLDNKPSINGVELIGDTSLDELDIASKDYVEEKIPKFNEDDYVKKVKDISPISKRIYGVGAGSTDTVMYDVENDFSTNTIPIRNEFGTFVVGRPFNDDNPAPKWYVDEKSSYKTLVDVTLDESNSGVNRVKFELPLDDFIRCKEFRYCYEIPSEVNKNETVTIYIADITFGAYAKCLSYESYAFVSGQIIRGAGVINSIGNIFFSISSSPTRHTGANSGSSGRTYIEIQGHSNYKEYPPYLYITLANGTTFPSGTRIIMEGR